MATTTLRIKGGPELRARLAAVAASGDAIKRQWTQEASRRIKQDAPVRTGHLRSSIEPGAKGRKATVVGAFYGVILDRGTKAYDIEPRNAQSLRYTYKGRTIFSKKSHRRRLKRRPFATKGAQDALRASIVHPGEVIKAWNRKRATGSFRKFEL